MTSARTRQGAALPLVIALVAIAAGAAVGWFGWTRAPEQFFYSYLVAWLYVTGLSLGSISLLLLHNLTGGKWGDLIRPVLRTSAAVLPLMALLFLPIVLQPQQLYEWANPSAVEHDPILQHKQPYLNVEFFQIRAAVYFALWFALLALLRWQARVAPLPDTIADRRFRRFSGQGLALHGLAITFASIDWIMSLEPHWFSTIFGVIWFGAWGLNALAFAIVIATAVARRTSAIEPYHVDSLHDLGKLLLGFTMFWAYVSFSQYFIIWYGNLPEEVVYYIKRFETPWQWVALALVLLHFVLPFALLLSRELKRNPAKLGGVALVLLVAEWISVLWQVAPAVEHGRPSFVPWLDLGLTAAVGGAWWLAFMLLLPRMAPPVAAGSGEVHHG
ncbi:MAG: hypothetical protein H0T51_26900 [Pirellulales bacterium]|nr:hypothetical protein [Pirellulales bacterium]